MLTLPGVEGRVQLDWTNLESPGVDPLVEAIRQARTVSNPEVGEEVGAGSDERVRGRGLPGMVASDQPNENVRINGAHAVSVCIGGSLL